MKKTFISFLLYLSTSCVADVRQNEDSKFSDLDLALISVVHGKPDRCEVFEAPQALDCDMGEWHALINTSSYEVYHCDEQTECPNIVHIWFRISCDKHNECVDQAW